MSYPVPYGGPGSLQSIQAAQGTTAPSAMELTKIVARVGEQALWSSYGFNSGTGTTGWAGTYDVFSTAVDQSGQGFTRNLTLSETNLQEGGRIPRGLSFKVYGVGLHPYGVPTSALSSTAGGGKSYPLSVPDYNAIQGWGVLSWKFLNSQIEIAPIQAIGAAGGTFGGTADTGAAYGGAGTTSAGSMVALNHGGGAYWVYSNFPVQLQSSVTLRVRITFGAGAPNIDGGPLLSESTPAYSPVLKVMLFGIYEQAIAVG